MHKKLLFFLLFFLSASRLSAEEGSFTLNQREWKEVYSSGPASAKVLPVSFNALRGNLRSEITPETVVEIQGFIHDREDSRFRLSEYPIPPVTSCTSCQKKALAKDPKVVLPAGKVPETLEGLVRVQGRLKNPDPSDRTPVPEIEAEKLFIPA